MSDETNPKAGAAFRDGKAPLDLLEPKANTGTAIAMGDGAKKYGRQNYLTIPIRYRTYLAAIQRHLDAIKDGEDIDPDSASGVHHLDSIGANVHVLRAVIDRDNFIDDRGPEQRTPEQEEASQRSNADHTTHINLTGHGSDGVGQ